MKKSHLLSAVLLCIMALTVMSCRKDKDEDLDIETQSASDNYIAESHINDVLKQVDDAATSSNVGKVGPVITIDSNANPKKMIINYGTGTFCNDGKTRAGKIVVTWTGRYRDIGTVITITPDSFYQNGNKVEGTKTVENKGRNSSNNLYFSVTVSNAKITAQDGSSRTWNATRNREWIAGEGTATILDDVYLITGSANGVNSNQRSYTSTITQALRVDFSCRYRITAGIVEVVPQGKLTRTVNYGSGTCDNSFSVTIGNKTYTVYK